MMLGVGPYITGSIIMQLLTIMVPRLKALYHEEGEAGRKRFSQYSRILTIPLAILQGFSLLAVLVRQGVIDPMSTMGYVVNIAVVTAGCLFLMWLGELISEFGIGNGVSIIIFAGIVASVPSNISQFFFTFDVAQIPTYLVFLVVGVVIIAGVVAVSEAERPVPVTYAKQVRGNSTSGGVSTYIPLRLNQAGVLYTHVPSTYRKFPCNFNQYDCNEDFSRIYFLQSKYTTVWNIILCARRTLYVLLYSGNI
jgi:preprotein translocase subunit SecY